MHAETISVGTEMTTGATLDTNSQWLSLELAAIGIAVRYHTTVADDLDAMVGVLRIAAARSDLVIVTGGLGPTLDDLTRDAMSALLGTELVLDPPSLEFIRSIFARHRRPMPERNTVQAYFPAGSQPIFNPRGTAPGIWASLPRAASTPGAASLPGAVGQSPCLLAALPGVPSEMKHMFKSEVVPRLPAGEQFIRRARLQCFGVGESKAEEMLGDLTARGRDPEVGITVHEATISLRIVAAGRSADECQSKIAATKALIRERMGDLIYGEEGEELEHVVVRELNARGLGLAIAEIGTVGLLAQRIAGVSGSANSFRGGIVGPTFASLVKLLRLRSDSSERPNVSGAAQAWREQSDSHFALLIGEFPAYDPLNAALAAPQSQIACATPVGARVVDYTFLGDPALNKIRAVKTALNLLRLHLLRTE